jgi:hypothetical protein
MKEKKISFDRIKILSGQLKNVYKEIDTHRELWHKSVRKMVEKTFQLAIKKSRLHLHICIYDEVINLESIQLTFGMMNSGLLIEPKKKKSAAPSMALLKRGGLLAYSLIASGKISVAIQYPYIEDIYGSPQNIRELGTFSPAEITHDMIIEHVEDFLEEMLKWEKEEKKLIGFHLKRDKK